VLYGAFKKQEYNALFCPETGEANFFPTPHYNNPSARSPSELESLVLVMVQAVSGDFRLSEPAEEVGFTTQDQQVGRREERFATSFLLARH
jgi:hypothetical protein